LYIEVAIGTQSFAEEQSLPDPCESRAPVSSTGRTAEVSLQQACAAGEIGAFEQVYHQYSSRLKSVAWNLLGNPNDAEDAVQEAFLKAYRGRAYFKGHASPATWLHRIVVNTCLDMRRRGKRHPEEPAIEAESGREAHASTGTPQHPLRVALEKSIAKLSDTHRTAFVLYEIEGFSHAEIAETLGITEAASKNRLFEAKRALRETLKRSSG
jgi:RNA polymerase sigma-70 factor (ECF subfamily)